MIGLDSENENVSNDYCFHSLISKQDWIKQPIVFESNFLKPDRRHIGRTQTMNNSKHVEKYTL